jgi:protein gp37
MSSKSTIEWTDATWNPVTGCVKVSPGCDHCYAETFAERFRGTPNHYFGGGFDVTLRPDKLTLPLKWKAPKKVFVNSMSDLFIDDVPGPYIGEVFAVMALARRHRFQVLTKRHARMRAVVGAPTFESMVGAAAAKLKHDLGIVETPSWEWPLPNVILGVSCEDQQWAETRIPSLLATPAAERFVSCEPLLGPIDLRNLKARNGSFIDCLAGDVKDDKGVYAACPGSVSWVIAGAESGRGARPMDLDWVRGLRDQCEHSAAFFFKQRVENGKKVPTPELDGRVWTQMPETLTAVAL